MTNGLDVPSLGIEEWLSVLKPYQRNSMEVLLKVSPENAAEKWISATGPQNTVKFGGATDTKPFWDNFQKEFKKFVCGDESYLAERNELSKGPFSKEAWVAAVSSAIGAKIGYAATLLAPAVVILFFTIGKIGKNAFCGMN